MFAYCGNNPVMYVDFSGRSAQSILDEIWSRFSIDSISVNDENDMFLLKKRIARLASLICSNELGKGWAFRIDKEVPGVNKRHIHVYNRRKNASYAQNDDGSPHDGSQGSPPKWVLQELKRKNGWDWEENDRNYRSVINFEQHQKIMRGFISNWNPFYFLLPSTPYSEPIPRPVYPNELVPAY